MSDGDPKELVLVVDDSRRQRALFRQFLISGKLCRVIEAGTAEEAYEILGIDDTKSTEKIDLIIMDVMMPGISGIEAAGRIKDTPHLKHIPIMIVTGGGETELLERAFAAGASDYIVKPVMMVELLARSRSLLSLKRETDIRFAREMELKKTVCELEEALAEVKTLSGLLPICAHCRKVRDDAGYWQQVETYLAKHYETKFSHGICPDCLEKKHPKYAKRVLERVSSINPSEDSQ